jgi:pyruvate dehydrogenase E2 component (dihydrolipoyllysine-residue acetyltransferase)
MPDVLMPRLSDTMTEGVLTQWLKQEGDPVHAGDVLAEIETDKATMELEAFDDGVLTRILAAAGTTVPIGEPIAIIGDRGIGRDSTTVPVADTPASAPTPPPERSAPDDQVPAAASSPRLAPPTVRTSPLARALAREHGIDLTAIAGTGPGGRIVRADVNDAIAAEAGTVPAAPTAAPSAAGTTALTTAVPDDDEQVPLTTMRRVTAQRLTESAAAPHFSLTSVVDAAAFLALRVEANEQVAATGTRISVTDLLIRACALTLRSHPQVNSSWAGDHLTRHRRIHVGSAVALTDGLIVPVIRDADRKSVTEIAAEAHLLTERARAGKLSPPEFTGGTFTVSNLGTFGVDHFTAVINPPQAAILAVGAATEQAVVREGQVGVATIMRLTLTVDHRVLDGATGAAFLRDLVQLLQQPLRIVL